MSTTRQSKDAFTRIGLLLTAVALGQLACHAHVPLPAPSTDATPEARMAAYKAVAPGKQDKEKPDHLALAGDRTVYHATDLIGVVPESSATAEAARESAEIASSANLFKILGAGAITAGAGLAFISTATLDEENPGAFPWIGVLGGLALAVVGGITGSVIGAKKEEASRAAAAKAFASYDGDLRKSLKLCGKGAVVYACENPPKPASQAASKPASKPASLPFVSTANVGTSSAAGK